MTMEIARAIEDILKPRGVAVLVQGAHMCARIRGVKKSGMSMTTRSLSGDFKTDSRLSADFLHMVQAPDFDGSRPPRQRRG
jgi:GTP cyclohydrolase I